MKNLVIVESPTKARTLSKFLGADYQIEASMGHIRDLPKSEMGIEIANNFEPKYIIPRDKKKKVNELKKLADSADNLWLATDPDREGEAIAWHLAYLLGSPKGSKTPKPMQRVEFHEITEGAIKDAFAHPREINIPLVDAQQARRILDRIVGYKLSPILWKKVKRGLSAGRVQTVALRLIVEREQEIEAFKPVEYWSLEAELKAEKGKFFALLIEINSEKAVISTKEQSDVLLESLQKATYQISKVTKKEVKRFAPAPFTTSTLQQTAGNRLGFTAKKTMMLAQNLYEQGLITYMRTDSVNLSTQAVDAARKMIEAQFGKNYLPSAARVFKSKSKNAQEAHEAIRPTNFNLSSEQLASESLGKDHRRLYELIYKRTVAGQMADAVFDQTTILVEALSNSDKYGFKATGSILKFDGWLKLYGVKQEIEEPEEQKVGKSDESEAETEKNQILPEMNEGENLNLLNLNPEQHFTQPPPRFTEASLIKKLEELGIGRPSTYAPTLATIQDRFYVEKEERKFKPTVLGLTAETFLLKHFPDIFDYTFTASMEDKLDDIANGQRQWKATIGEFYQPLEKKLEETMETADRVDLPVETVDKQCPKCGKQLLVKTGKFGKFLACSGFPDCKHTESFDQPLDIKCPQDGGDVVMRKTKKGRPFFGCKNYPTCNWASWVKPKTEEEKKAEESTTT